MSSLSTTNQAKMFRDPESEASKAKKKAIQRLSDSTKGLVFEPGPHKYYLGSEQIKGVSSIVESYAPFDTLACAKGVSQKPNHPLYGHSVEEILKIWAEKRDSSAAAGTKVHEFGEACFLSKSGQTDVLSNTFADRITSDGLAASSPKEEAMVRFWESIDLDRYVLITKETTIFNPIHRYAGTFDLLLYDLKLHKYLLKDFKTNENLFKWFGGKLKAPLTLIKDDDHGKYTLQQNLYRIQLENLGLEVASMELIWLKETGDFEAVPLPDYQKLIRYALTVNPTNN